ncbi:MAG TPA: 30S ribosomal protein S17 [Bdellovibrionota bacterium]|nr:30S ribosomal protein S17 [Bdellovibrionota bacterium]
MSEVSATVRRQYRELVGTVVGDAMNKTIVVEVQRLVKHPLYEKFFVSKKKFFAHDEENQAKIGDQVKIVSSRPLSRGKRWMFRGVLRKAAGIGEGA